MKLVISVFVICILLLLAGVFAVAVEAQELKSVVMKYSSTMDLSVKTRNFINSVDTAIVDSIYEYTVHRGDTIHSEINRNLSYSLYFRKTLVCIATPEDVVKEEILGSMIMEGQPGEAIIFYREERR